MKNIFIEGIQGLGKSTLLQAIATKYPKYQVCREGDYSPVELAWCSWLTKTEYEEVLTRYDAIRDEIARHTVIEEACVAGKANDAGSTSDVKNANDAVHYIVAYTKILTDIPGFHKDLEQYEIYNGRKAFVEMREIIFERYVKFFEASQRKLERDNGEASQRNLERDNGEASQQNSVRDNGEASQRNPKRSNGEASQRNPKRSNYNTSQRNPARNHDIDAEKASADDNQEHVTRNTYLFECSFLQNIVEDLILFHQLSDDEIVAFYQELYQQVDKDRFLLLYLYSDNLEESISIIKQERSDGLGNEMWYPLMLEYLANSPYGKKHGYKDFGDMVSHFRHRQQLEMRIIKEVVGENAIVLPAKEYTLEQIQALLK